MRLLVVRHGESTWNVEGRYQGRLNAPLSGRGQAQARALSEYLRAHQNDAAATRVARIVTSPLARAHDTAAPAAAALGLAVETDERLTEISHGSWEGKLRDEVAQRWPEMFAAWREHPETVRFPSGETLGDVNGRIESFLQSIQNANDSVLVFTHDVIVRLVVLKARNLSLAAFHQIHIDNAAINEVELRVDRLQLVRLNDVAPVANLRSDLVNQAL